MKLLFFAMAPIRGATHLGLNTVQHIHSAVPELTVLLVFSRTRNNLLGRLFNNILTIGIRVSLLWGYGTFGVISHQIWVSITLN